MKFSWRYGTTSCVATLPSMPRRIPSPEKSQKTTPFSLIQSNATLSLQNLKKKTKTNKSKPKIPKWIEHANFRNKPSKRKTHQSSHNRNLLSDLRKGSQNVNLVKMSTNWDENCERHQDFQLNEKPSFIFQLCSYGRISFSFSFSLLGMLQNCNLFCL